MRRLGAEPVRDSVSAPAIAAIADEASASGFFARSLRPRWVDLGAIADNLRVDAMQPAPPMKVLWNARRQHRQYDTVPARHDLPPDFPQNNHGRLAPSHATHSPTGIRTHTHTLIHSRCLRERLVSHRSKLACKEVGDAATEESDHHHPGTRAAGGAAGDGRAVRRLGAEEARQERPTASPSAPRASAGLEEQGSGRRVAADSSGVGANKRGDTACSMALRTPARLSGMSEATSCVSTATMPAAVSGGPAPARAYIEELLPDILEGRIEPGRVFDRVVSLDEVPDGYRAMNERDAIKIMIEVSGGHRR